MDDKTLKEIKTFSKNIENELGLFEISFVEAKEKLQGIEIYIKQKFIEMRGQIEQLKQSNNITSVPKMVDALLEIQRIIDKYKDIENVASI